MTTVRQPEGHDAAAELRRRRRRHASVAAIIALALILAILLFTRTAQAIEAQSVREWREVDAVFAPWNTPATPGCALGVFRDGQIAYERGYGMADLEHDIPITPATVFYVGSVSKQFTAMAAALAIQKGLLSAEDPIRRWLPELPPYADAISVRHLVHHTSGLRDYNTLLSIAGRRGDEAFDNRAVLRMTARQRALNFEPGTEYLYSNTGYTLLATIVERATKTPFAAFTNATIFKPLGMTASHFHTDAGRLVKRRAMGYQSGEGGALRLDSPSNERAGAGGVFTSVRELLSWDENFYTGRVGGKALVEQLQTSGTLMSGTLLDYGWGLRLATYRGLRTVEHTGSLGGYRSHLMRFPERHTSFAVLCNAANGAETLARRVADVVLGSHFTQPSPAPAAASVRGPRAAADAPVPDAVALSAYTGIYASDEIEAAFTVAVTDGRLTLQRDSDTAPVRLEPVQPDAFRAPGFTLQFERAGGRVPSLVVDAGRVRGIRFVRR